MSAPAQTINQFCCLFFQKHQTMKKIATIIILSFAMFAITAQESTTPIFKTSSFGSSMGFVGSFISNTTSDYYSLAGNVGDANMFVDIENWEASKYNYGVGGNGDLQFYLGLTPYSKKSGEYRKDRELRLNFGFSFGARRTFSYYNRDTFTFDSFT